MVKRRKGGVGGGGGVDVGGVASAARAAAAGAGDGGGALPRRLRFLQASRRDAGAEALPARVTRLSAPEGAKPEVVHAGEASEGDVGAGVRERRPKHKQRQGAAEPPAGAAAASLPAARRAGAEAAHARALCTAERFEFGWAAPRAVGAGTRARESGAALSFFGRDGLSWLPAERRGQRPRSVLPRLAGRRGARSP